MKTRFTSILTVFLSTFLLLSRVAYGQSAPVDDPCEILGSEYYRIARWTNVGYQLRQFKAEKDESGKNWDYYMATTIPHPSVIKMLFKPFNLNGEEVSRVVELEYHSELETINSLYRRCSKCLKNSDTKVTVQKALRKLPRGEPKLTLILTLIRK